MEKFQLIILKYGKVRGSNYLIKINFNKKRHDQQILHKIIRNEGQKDEQIYRIKEKYFMIFFRILNILVKYSLKYMQTRDKKLLEEKVDKKLCKMLKMAAAEKLVPRMICQGWMNTKSQISNRYKETVKQIYNKETKKPLKYSYEQARSQKQKFKEKVLKIANNQIPIDYLDIVKVKGKNVMMYKNHPLEEVQYPTKRQFAIFENFNENKFKNGYNDIFEDKLEFQPKRKLRSSDNFINKNKTCPNENQIQLQPSIEQKERKQLQNSNKKKPVNISLPRLISGSKLIPKKLSTSPKPDKKYTFRIISGDQDEEILSRMRVIGGFGQSVPHNKISLTKESIVRYFRQCYTRPHRIIDFLEISGVENLQSFKAIPQKLKLMQKDHIDFMAFIFYDSNNDGIICNRDLDRLQNLVKKCPLLEKDYQRLKKNAFKFKLDNDCSFQSLYRLPQITESAYFKWKNSDKDIREPIIDQNPQLSEYLSNLNRKKTTISFNSFQKIFKNDKPFLWYDLIWRISGLAFEGFIYQ